MLFDNDNEGLREELIKTISEYIKESKYVFMATATKKGPALRTVAPFAADQLVIYFSSVNWSVKISQIEENPSIALLFQHENQDPAALKNVAYSGKAQIIYSEQEMLRALALLGEKEPWFKNLQPGSRELKDLLFVKIQPKNIQYLDFSRGRGKDAITEIGF